ncbi:hypothetical protein [Flexivirga oryzae]|uniref:Putative membrane-anchored protein n=1 Tax=Flexivirga oryzae TaxID=1794944 RepID=A0A839N804_9MICO|nr:putative membrane-anchored protein [Flexivirga oryzae]
MTISSTRPDRATAVSWVAPVGVTFWALKLLTTAFGEAASDGLAGISPALAVLVGVAGIVITLRWQTRSHSFVARRYWSAVAAVAVFGTMLADGLHVALGLPYPVTSVLYAVATASVFVVWRRCEGTISIHDIFTVRRERFYWAAVMCTFALGTAVGDLTAATLGLGYWPSAVLFAILIAIPALVWRATGRHEVLWFWCAYVLTRPLGASIADGLAKPASMGRGMGLGDVPVACIIGLLLVGAVVLFAGPGGRPAAPRRQGVS